MTSPTSTPSSPDSLRAARDRLLEGHDAVPTSALRRLWRTGRSAVGIGSAVLRSQRGEALDLAQVESLVMGLGGLKGTAMKVGQMLGYIDPTLPPELRRMLSLLQTAAPSATFTAIEATIRRALGPRAEALLAGLEHEPLAAASIGQVHRGRLPDGTAVVVKIRHEGIVDALEADFRTASLGKVFGTLAGAGTITDVIDEAKTAFLEECDYGLEASRQRRFATLFADDPDVIIPPVETDWCGEGVLVTRRVEGRSLAAFLADDPSQAARDRAGAALFRFWMRTLYRDGLFHADPHPGNFAFCDDGRIVIYDFGCVRSFDTPLRRGFAELAAATRVDDIDAMARAVERLGGRAPRDADGRTHMRRLLHGFFGPLRHRGARRIADDEGLDAREVMRDKLAIAKMQLPGRLLFLFRLRFGLYAVLAQLGASVDWAALEEDWAADAH